MDVRDELDEAIAATEEGILGVSVNRSIYLLVRALREIIRLLDERD